VAKQRIILVNNSRLMRDMLKRVISKAEGLEIVSDLDDLAEFPEAVKRMEADWAIVLLPPDEGIPDLVEQVINEQPSMRFLLMGVDGSHARIKWNEPHEVPLDKKNLQELLALLQTDRQERILA
jgi:DNA-binding NarL/FixJ family response regulator